jgi:uncharacterized protein
MALYIGTPVALRSGFFISYFCIVTFDSSRHKQIAALVARCTGFEWDAGNSGKNWESHKVADNESEEVFDNAPLMFRDDIEHSMLESRYIALGKTDGNRLVSNVFTIRGDLIRIISSQDMSRRNRRTYGTA